MFGDIHRQARQRATLDEFDRVMEPSASDEGRFMDDCREQSSGQLERQQNRGISDLNSSANSGTVCSICPWIAEHAGFLLSRFEVGQDGKSAHGRFEGKSANMQGMMFADKSVEQEGVQEGPLGKTSCMWEDGVD